MAQKISKYKTATAYAQAWLEAAKDAHQEEAVYHEVKTLKEAFNKSSDIRLFLAAPTDSQNEKIQIIAEFAQSAKLSDITAQTLKLIAEYRRLDLIDLIFDEFIRRYYEDKGIISVQVETAVKLTAAQDSKLKKTLENKLGAEVILNYQIKPEVLGGLAVSYQSVLIDDTIASKLKDIQREMIRQG